jgi:2-polyprenyl-3-methyl-5-hydroxy-6-metoxy-1,4-benzoquinol methylase
MGTDAAMRARTAVDTPSRSELVELQQTLYASRNPTRRSLHQTRRAWIEAALRRLAAEREHGTALEVGPGSGVYLDLLCELFAKVTASDVEDEYLDHVAAQATGHANLELAVDDIGATALEPQSFDLVLCSEVIEHTPDPAAVLAGLQRVLRPGGVLVLSTPQAHSTLELAGKLAFQPGIIRLVRLVYREPILPTGHISLLTAKRLRNLLDESGLEVIEHDTSGLYIPLLAELGGRPALRFERWLERRIDGGPLSGMLWTQYWIAERAR